MFITSGGRSVERSSFLIRAPMGNFRTLPADGGPGEGERFAHRCYLPNYWTDSRSENGNWWPKAWTFWVFCKTLSECHWWRHRLGQISDFLTICIRWLRRTKQPYRLETESVKWHGSCLECSLFLEPWAFGDPCVKLRSSKVMRSKVVRLKILG